MNLDIKGVHYDITDVTRGFIQEKIGKVKYADEHIVDLLFTLTKQPKDWKAEVNVHLRWGTHIHLEEIAFNLHEALEKLIDRLDAQVSKEKAKVQDHHHDRVHQEPQEP